MCHFLVEKICHWPNWVGELWVPLGWPETGTDLLRLLFVEPSIYVFVSEENSDLCVWIYLVWWAIITCGGKSQLSEVDAHMDQLLLAPLIGHISLIFSKSRNPNSNKKLWVQKDNASQYSGPGKTWVNNFG